MDIASPQHKNTKLIVMLVGILLVVAGAVVGLLLRPAVSEPEPEPVNVVAKDITEPVIEGGSEITIYKNSLEDVLDQFKIFDESGDEVKVNVEGAYDPTAEGSYELKITAIDESGNVAEKAVTLNIVRDPEVVALGKSEYYIEVNRLKNRVAVYALDRDGEYKNLVKVFVASTGKAGSETILGTYRLADRYPALYLVGDVWGQYAVRINGSYYFHSVPYFSKGAPNWDNLEYLEYNKLGQGASAGCVRLAVRDAKWIYDNATAGTTVKIYDSEADFALEPEAPIRIDVDDERRGWDPTDPNPANPWN